ncbi:MAG TPA: hypothetical protein VGM90_20150 [Kofleriaceae bacterium]|jgi:hypothetical protein
MKWLAASALLFAACDGTGGTIALTLTTAPSSTLLADIHRLRVSTTNPDSVTEATRSTNGIDLSLELTAQDTPGEVFVQGYDDADVLIATGQSPPFTLGGGDANLVIYVAEPLSINEAPVRLSTGRADLAATEIVFGAVIAGGVDGAGSLSDSIAIYNVYSHSFQVGMGMPSKRRGQAVGANVNGGVYLFGGAGENGTVTSTLYEFISTTAPSGSYIDAGEQTGFERTGQQALGVGADMFVVTGSPPLNVGLGALTARTDMPGLLPRGAGSINAPRGLSGTAGAIRADGLTLVRFDQTEFVETDLPVIRDHASVAALPDGGFAIAGGADTSVMRITPDGLLTQLTNALSTPRSEPSVAATSHYVVVAGGLDAASVPIASADILDATTLELVTTVPIAARAHAQAITMQNGQVMLVGGDVATDLIELFTPPIATN